MNQLERKELANYRIAKAKETLEEVDLLISNERWNSAVNRLYYACFYATSALLVYNDIYSKTHSGTKQMLGLHFVNTALIEKKYAVFYSELFDMRQQGDYEDFFYFEKDDVLSLIAPAKAFIEQIRNMIPGAYP